MFEAAEIGHKLPKGEYKRIEPQLRADLLDAQYELSRDGRFPVVVLISGVRGAGKGETVNLLNEWMDPRHIHTHAFDNPTDEERERPPMWRYWRALPPKGKVGMLFGSWYTAPIIDRVFKRTSPGDLVQSLDEIRRFERMLADDGVLLLKFWFHLSKKRQRERLKALQEDSQTSWRVTQRDWDFFKYYDRFYRISEDALRQTSLPWAPWTVVEGSDPQYRVTTVARTLLEAMRARINQPLTGAVGAPQISLPPLVRPADGRDVLNQLDLSKTLPKKAFDTELARQQQRLALLTRHPKFREHHVVAVFEGMDAAGKGGAIRRITGALDARLYRIIPIAAPTDEERAQPYLWRFWRHVPMKGRFTIYDRSWYGRVLVERVEKFAAPADWARAYSEINDFEEQLAHNGGIIVKYWLQISKEEQLRRFQEREKTLHKQFKITEEDWRNRKKWAQYQLAAAEMVERTSTTDAPWTLVPSNDKYQARIQVITALCDRIEAQF
ncbi:MAG: polyphosphate:AMP phosphotransferase [Rhodoferax sp.]|nr:polyphosphate:AMP phosphotransferase [Rhodoferax sp.]